MKNTDLAYFAGFFDGEGCIRINKDKRSVIGTNHVLFVTVVNTNEWVIRQMQFSFGGCFSVEKARDNHREAYRLTLSSRKAVAFLKSVLPYLKLKKPEAEIAIKFQSRKKQCGIKGVPLERRILEEADRILLQNMKKPKVVKIIEEIK